MGLSRQARIITLLVIDTAFFFLELIVGYAVGSLALVADSFHMLNDVLSLVVALYTIKLATSPSSDANSYGWQRAEILGALINGVFLVALCVSIALEAVGRIFAPPEISNPKLIVIVGSLGLLSNIVGLFLFHEHGHSHGHSHGPVALTGAEDEPTPAPRARARADSIPSLYQHPAETRAQIIEAALQHKSVGSLDESFAKSPPPAQSIRHQSMSRRSKRGDSSSRPRSSRQPSAKAVPPTPGSNETLPPPPSDILAGSSSAASTSTAVDSPAQTDNGHAHDHEHPHNHQHDHDHSHVTGQKHDHAHKHVHMADDADAAERGGSHAGHNHSHGAGGQGRSHDENDGHGHSHGSMNMRGVFLHVLGDALGNVGVIAAGLVIWFCEGRWTLYFDPGVSLIITCIIFSSAIPLVKSASYILLQGVPNHVSLDAVRSSIKGVGGVVSVHELHVWQLSESTIVASVHVLIMPGSDYMAVANGIRHELHDHGIHSVTIQPEFSTNDSDEDAIDDEMACLIRCPPEQCAADTCCPPAQAKNGRLVDVEENDEHEGHSH